MTDQIPDVATQRAFNQTVIDEFRANHGKVSGPFEGQDLLLLTTQGAKSGLPRLVPLSYLTIEGAMILVGSLAGRRCRSGLGAQPASQPASTH